MQYKIAVSGINAIDNPGPGTGIARSLKDSDLDIQMIGLAYDAMEPGIYMDWVIDKSYLLPYPSGNLENYLDRLKYIHQKEKLDAIIPALDVELPIYQSLEKDLTDMGIKLMIPNRQKLKRIQKNTLDIFAQEIGIQIPPTKTLSTQEDLGKAVEEFGLPLMVKGPFYEAYKATTFDEAIQYFHQLAYKWGYPVLAQKYIHGDEYNLVGLGDGKGNDLGHVAVKKMMVTKLGKVWTNVSIKNEAIETFANSMLKSLKWAGGYELELLLDHDSGEFNLIEINPRYPAWTYMASACGINLPLRQFKHMMGLPYESHSNYEAGKMLIRYTGEMVKSIGEFEKLAVTAES